MHGAEVFYAILGNFGYVLDKSPWTLGTQCAHHNIGAVRHIIKAQVIALVAGIVVQVPWLPPLVDAVQSALCETLNLAYVMRKERKTQFIAFHHKVRVDCARISYGRTHIVTNERSK